MPIGWPFTGLIPAPESVKVDRPRRDRKQIADRRRAARRNRR